MKTCSKCKIKKEEGEFFFKNKTKGLLHSYCKECKRLIDRENYQTDHKSRKRRVRENTTSNNEKARAFIRRVKQRLACQNCGDKRWYVLDFHHLGEKEKTISIMVYHSIKAIKKEMRKCKVLCANCHREEHFLQKEKKLTR